jgi:calcineurin-like phosphoesterase family protein
MRNYFRKDTRTLMQIWLHSDWHRKHANIYKFTAYEGGPRIRERFKDHLEGDAYMEQRYRELVKPEDHVYFLGDLQFGSYDDFEKFWGSLPGKRRLVLGNHDKERMDQYHRAGFQKIFASRLCSGVLLTHYPVHPEHIGKALGNAHGHIHQNPSPSGPYFNCCVEVNNFEPIPIELVKQELVRKRTIQAADVSGVPIFGD